MREMLEPDVTLVLDMNNPRRLGLVREITDSSVLVNTVFEDWSVGVVKFSHEQALSDLGVFRHEI